MDSCLSYYFNWNGCVFRMFIDSYIMKWKLRDEKGNEWEEIFNNISLSDFEIIYECNKNIILEVEMRLVGKGVLN